MVLHASALLKSTSHTLDLAARYVAAVPLKSILHSACSLALLECMLAVEQPLLFALGKYALVAYFLLFRPVFALYTAYLTWLLRKQHLSLLPFGFAGT